MSDQIREAKRKQAIQTQVLPGHYLARDRKIPLPAASAPKWRWEPSDNLAVTTMTDSALAAQNAINKVWPKYRVYSGFCAVHASKIWFSKSEHNSLLRAKKDDHNVGRKVKRKGATKGAAK